MSLFYVAMLQIKTDGMMLMNQFSDTLLHLPFWLTLLIMMPIVFVQNMAFTWSSRSRNSSDVNYHRYASWCSNGVWFATQVLFLGTMIPSLMSGSWLKVLLVGICYTLSTSEGSCYMMRRLLKTETEKRRPGAK